MGLKDNHTDFEELLAEQRHKEVLQVLGKILLPKEKKDDPELKALIRKNAEAIELFIKKVEQLKQIEAPKVTVQTNQAEVVKEISKLAATATESQDAIFVLLVSIIEAANSTDSTAAVLSRLAGEIEAASATETSSTALITLSDIAESAVSDSVQSSSLIASASITETVSASDSTDAVIIPIDTVFINENATADDIIDAIISGGGAQSGSAGHHEKIDIEFERNKKYIELLKKEDEDILIIIEAFMKCQQENV